MLQYKSLELAVEVEDVSIIHDVALPLFLAVLAQFVLVVGVLEQLIRMNDFCIDEPFCEVCVNFPSCFHCRLPLPYCPCLYLVLPNRVEMTDL